MPNSPSSADLLHNPHLNRGSAFPLADRRALHIEGLLPPAADTLEIQIARVHAQLAALDNDLQKYLFLTDLQSRNEVLFYAVLMSDPAIFMPLVYTPIDEFVEAVQALFPKCCLQWEDFAKINAVPILARYRDKICTYNDDIQGTAAVALAGILAALRITKQKLTEQRFLFLGGGSAATGIAELISEAMALEGLPIDEARARNWLFDINGLMVTSRTDLAEFQKPFAHAHAPVSSFVAAVEAIRPTGIIGVSTVPKLFNQPVIEAMARINERPIIFPYSNPTSRSECTAEEAYKWSAGRAVFASGSPFPPVEIDAKRLVLGQGNNVYIFPAMGVAVLATKARRVTEEMFLIAARAVAEQVTEANLAIGLIYPPTSKILDASLHTAARIAEYIFDHDLAGIGRPDDIQAHIRARAYEPVYPVLV